MKEYEGTAYIGVVGAETENGECRDTIEAIERREGDGKPLYIRATKGYEARQMHINNWYGNTEHAFILLIDHDMKFPANTLEQLRSHKLPYVSGAYLRRMYAPIAPVWYEQGEAGVMPMTPYTSVPMEKALYKIGASGWGCILLHRDVITDVRKILKGEPEVIEDDMDLYPYDLKRIMGAIHDLDNLANNPESGSREDALKQSVQVLKEEIRPLRGLKDVVGSDIRFPFYARLAGYELCLDTGVMCDHMLNYPISVKDYINQSAANIRDTYIQTAQGLEEERERIRKAIE